MSEALEIKVRLSAQVALLSQIPPSLRAVSIDISEQKIRFRCFFGGDSTDEDRELLSMAATEILASFPTPCTIEEEYLVAKFPSRMSHLKYLIYLRHEKAERAPS